LDREGKAEPPDWYIHDVEPGVLARSCGSMALALLGRTDEAHSLAHDAVALGRASRNRFNHGFALCFAGLALHSCGDPEGLLALGQEGVRVCSEEGYPTLIGLAAALEGCARAALGRPQEGAKRVAEGLALGSRARALVEGPRVLGLLAEAQRAAGEASAARGSALAGVRVGTTHGIHFWKAELLRLAADIALENGLLADPSEAASDLRIALDLAHRQGAVLFEARVRETLARYKIESV
jgi:hypothetical protein